MRVVITGGSGFIGTNLMLHLAATEPETEIVIADIAPPQVELPPEATFVYCDIRNLSALVRTFEGADEVYHLAGILGTSELLPIASLAAEVNVCGALNVLDAARLTGVKRVYNVAKPHFESLRENAYTLTKHAGELAGLMYREKFGLNVSTVRWLNAVGPYQHLYPVRKLVPALVLFALHGIDLEVYGDGSQTIDPIDARDMARFTVYACRNMTGSEVVDLGSGDAITCNHAAKIILEEVSATRETRSKVINVPMREGEKPGVNLVADTSYWDNLGMKTQYDFRDSVRTVIEDIQSLPMYHQRNALAFYGKVSSVLGEA